MLADERLGMIGTCRHHCDGRPRPVDNWDFLVRRRRAPVRPFREGNSGGSAPTPPRPVGPTRHRPQADVAAGGTATGTASTVWAARTGSRAGFWNAWPSEIGSVTGRRGWSSTSARSVCIALYVEAVGLQQADAERAGDVFGVEYRELPMPPRQLLGRRLRGDPQHQGPGRTPDETAIRAFFRAQRSRQDPAKWMQET